MIITRRYFLCDTEMFLTLNASFCLISLNHISSVIPDEPEFLRHVTQLDVRDNRLSELDASVFPRLEVLHCQRNCIAHLRLRGCMLKALYASSNGTAGTIIMFFRFP